MAAGAFRSLAWPWSCTGLSCGVQGHAGCFGKRAGGARCPGFQIRGVASCGLKARFAICWEEPRTRVAEGSVPGLHLCGARQGLGRGLWCRGRGSWSPSPMETKAWPCIVRGSAWVSVCAVRCGAPTPAVFRGRLTARGPAAPATQQFSASPASRR